MSAGKIRKTNAPVAPPAVRVTLTDVARHVGMSKSTVSRALHLSPTDYPLKAETRKQIADAALELGYSPSWRGRMLSQSKTRQIGMLFAYAIPELRGIYENMLEGLTTALEKRGYSLLFIPVHGPHWQQMILDGRVDGCVIAHGMTPELHQAINAANVPVVMLNELPVGNQGSVIPDDAAGARLAVEHLLKARHRRIAYVRMAGGSDLGHHSLMVRKSAYEVAMRAAGLTANIACYNESLNEFVDELAGQPSGRRHTAALCYTHTEAVKLLPLLHAKGIRVPQDLSIICFNDVFPLPDLMPAISAIDVPGKAIGRTGANMLIDMLENEVKPHQVMVPETLVSRTSVCTLAEESC